MTVIAKAKEVRISPRKMNVVAALVRGRTVEDALVILEHTPRRAAKPLSKVIASARANAENNHGYKADTLVISSLNIGQGESMKRYRPAAHGRAQPYKKRTSNIRVEVEGKKKPSKKEKEAAKKAKSEANKVESKKSEKSDKESK